MTADQILTAEALEFLTLLQRELGPARAELLAGREAMAGQLRRGGLPDFLPETTHVRESDWRVPPAPSDLVDRRVEMTGPTDRRMVVNALNSGARVFMADFEGSKVTPEQLERAIGEEAAKLGPEHEDARNLFEQLASGESFVEFLTLPANAQLEDFPTKDRTQ